MQDHESTDSWFKVALKEICLMLRLYITQATSDQQAIVFYGTVSNSAILLKGSCRHLRSECCARFAMSHGMGMHTSANKPY